MKKVLREYIRIAKEFGLERMGQDGEEHYIFGAGGKVLARGPSTPRSESIALVQFRARCAKKTKLKTALTVENRCVDGNAAFRELDRKRKENRIDD